MSGRATGIANQCGLLAVYGSVRRKLTRSQVTILLYHRVGPDADTWSLDPYHPADLNSIGCGAVSAWALRALRLGEELIERFGFKTSAEFACNKSLEETRFGVWELDAQVPATTDIRDRENWRVTHAYVGIT